MKNKIFKPLFLASLLPVLAGCSVLNNALATVALNMVFESPLLLNHASLSDGNFEIEQYETLPTSEASRADVTYGLEALAIPEYLAVSQMGFNIEIDFTLTFSEGARDLFYIEKLSTEDAAEETPADAVMQILYPIGSQDEPESMEQIADWVSIERLLDLKKEVSKDISITITGTSGTKTKSKVVYFNLNSDGITVPGGGEIDIDIDSALIMTEVGVEATLDLTLTPAEQVAGKAFALQLVWGDLTFGPSQTGTATISIKNESALTNYDLTLPALNEIELTSNDTVGSYSFTIKLKTGQPTPTAPLVVTIGGILTLPVA